jgi:hypothetical protein
MRNMPMTVGALFLLDADFGARERGWSAFGLVVLVSVLD